MVEMVSSLRWLLSSALMKEDDAVVVNLKEIVRVCEEHQLLVFTGKGGNEGID